ncbi:predicted protein [Chaetomium globosum CBS 148.51]|uniref:Uncharacterized protein n=1 Tax=Chaetomium globosum (strain ATCC 6205 / CBS 148.51 / DSM 1962 / NBRC 6347 / NRRL 1970) TaxID=306901 RepID=Q2HHI9_CHAGB|nr:uncharacterized protein CHGG_00315 [Chaetomium globosum CBS 148.51]EAQ92080.1 predicted protein [Chaetomium globosum CBS 148.51]
MDPYDGRRSPDFIFFGDEGKKPIITEYARGSKFHSGDKVYLLSEDGRFRTGGPYYIGDMGSNSSLTMYTLISEDGGKVLDGAEVKEERLEEYKG